MSIRSYVRSTDYHRKPCGENIICGIDISVVVRPTFRAVPLPNIKRQFIDNVTAVSTAFRAGKPAVNFNQCATVPLAFVFQLSHQLRPACISNSCTKFAVLHHVLHSQVFDSNRLIFACQSSRQLVKEVFASVGNGCLNPGNFTPCFFCVIRSFYSTRQSFLSLSQFKSKASEVFGVSNLLPLPLYIYWIF